MKRLVLVLALLSLPRLAHATVVMDLNGAELAAVADAIVHARVVKISGHVTSQARVFTDAEVEVLDGLKGAQNGAHLNISYPGGSWAGLGMIVSGQVALKQGQECIIYLHKTEGDSFIPAGMSLGFYEVEARPSDGVPVAKLSTTGLTLVRKEKVKGKFQTVVKDGRDIARPLNLVLEDIRKDLDAAKKLDRATVLGGQK